MIKIIYTKQSLKHLQQIKEFISKNNPQNANNFLLKIKQQIELLVEFPQIGKVNLTMNHENIRDYVVQGYKIIYKINDNNILIIAVYKNTNFDESILSKYK
ncbi:MAG: hypothetical protein DRQ51_09865 [Gammaproteobacteria bacterium]|nr:MAG: hypothetical protein DRQ51_09865 [Gammaproteobacteria bacterium]